ncbi:hypothetical protein KC340_g14497 [Hortaea werneckii]|nr:hypothetical protein KC342_g14899 [Hortaea werneckii]KAI7065720.1 hypothetical protein KC339_g15727 [Hortaea werneckii]KAI7215401.1 hypothetical protein KC365_g13579 [Hortaea werneckii]KAI7298146.1 hypothetical protein KC340_g14497 [Hortaea werneckii]KAI7378566.1 hypothetical protein KC328_g13821 [Hortaea werneckii]
MSTLAFFGATGDCAGYCLAHALNAGYDCRALARTPAKLTASLKNKDVSPETLDKHLTITQGDVKDVSAVKETLSLSAGHPGNIVDKIISGIGGAPAFQWSLTRPFTLGDPTICQDAGQTILKALGELQSSKEEGKKPILINVSTTGIPSPGCPRDVPLLFVPLYHWALAVPHEDKKVLQKTLAGHMKSESALLRGFVHVKPSLLMDGEAMGLQAVRDGVETAPAVGYTIRRADVGSWMFERLVKGDVKREWTDRSVCVTY